MCYALGITTSWRKPMSRLSTVLCTILLITLSPACGQSAESGAMTIPDSPDGTVRAVAESLADSHPEVIWHALPPSYQQDVTGLIHLAADTVDPEVYAKSFAVLNKVVGVLRAKRDLILDTVEANMPQANRATIEENWDHVLDLFDIVLSSEIASLDGLREVDPEAYLATTGRKVMLKAAEISPPAKEGEPRKDLATSLRAVKVEVVSSEGDSATVRISPPDEEPETVALTRVEGRWVPADMAAEWDEKVAEARAEMSQVTDEEQAQMKMQAMMMLSMAETVADQVAAAETQEDLQALLQGMFGGLMSQLQPQMREGEQEPMQDEMMDEEPMQEEPSAAPEG